MNNKAYNNSSNINLHIASYSSLVFYIVIGLIIFICVTFSSCGRASADSMQVGSLEDILTFIDGNFNSTQLSSIESAYNSNQYYMFMNYNGKKFIYFFDDLNLCPSNFGIQTGSVSYGDSGYYRQTALVQSNYKFTCFYYNGSSWSAYSADRFTLEANKGSYFLYSTNLIIPSGFSRASNDSPFYANDSLALDHIYRNFSGKLASFSYSSNSSTFIDIELNTFSYVSDDRLKFSTSLRGDGEKVLNVDLSDFLSWSPTSGMSVSDLVLTLDCDGIEISVSLDSSNSEIIFTKNELNYTYRCVYIIPYSELGLDEYEDVTIVKCDFTRNYSHLGPSGPVDETENFKIACNYILKNETAPLVSDEITLDSSVNSDKLTAVEITDLHNSFQFSDGEFVSDLSDIVPPDNFTFAEITVSTLPLETLNNILSYVPYILLTPEAGINTRNAAEKAIYEYLEKNYYTCVFDYLIFDWVFYDDPDDPNAGYDHLYFYYNTLSGRVRLIDNVLGDIYVDVNQNTANTAAIYNYLYTRLNDFEDKSLDAFNDIIGLDRQRNSWLSTLSAGIDSLTFVSSNGFADVVDAVNAIEFDYVPFDDSDVLSVLSGISSLLSSILGRDDNEDDTVAEAIAYYQSNNSNGLPTLVVFTDNKMSLWMSGKVHIWLQGSTAADSRQGLLIDSFDFMTQFYDSLQSHGLIGGVRNYVRSFTSGTSSGSAETVYKTIWTGSFNPNLKDGE